MPPGPVAVRLLLDAGDEAIYSEPAWFCYEPMLLLADAIPKKVMLKGDRFDLAKQSYAEWLAENG